MAINTKCFKQSWAVASYQNSELLQRANFPVASAGAPLFFEKITDAVASYHHFTAITIRYFGVSGGQRKKFARALLSAHVDSNCSSHRFALVLDDLFAVR